MSIVLFLLYSLKKAYAERLELKSSFVSVFCWFILIYKIIQYKCPMIKIDFTEVWK